MGVNVFDLPDLTGQPPWVIIVVVFLVAAGSVGVAWARRGTPGDSGDDEIDSGENASARPTAIEAVPSSSVAVLNADVHTTLVLKQALDHLAREALESQEARAETAKHRKLIEELRGELTQCGREREVAVRQLEQARLRLEQCNERCARLAEKALNRGAHDEQR